MERCKTTAPAKQSFLIDSVIKKIMKGEEVSASSEELTKIIDQLINARTAAIEKEREESRARQEAEAKKREEEERARQEAHINQVTSMELPLDWENAFSGDPRAQGLHTDSISDALILSLSNLARVDIEYISSITGRDYKTVIETLKGSIYQNPETWGECFYKGWETAEEYLSGNLVRKWRAAKDADATYKGYFKDNVMAIERVLPKAVATKDIYVTLGSPWVPADIIDDFITHILKLKGGHYKGTLHDELTGSWEIPHKGLYWSHLASTSTYGTPRLEALYILERTLNMKTIAVTDEVVCLTNRSGKKRVVNQAETVLALEKQRKMISEFQRWVWQDEKRKERLETIFENNFSCVRRRMFDGSFLEFPTMSPNIELYPYQKNAVARILFSPNTLLAHDVGSGKTYVMIAAGMELKRMGLSSKNLYVVPNNIVGQWKNVFKVMYPNAKVLCIEPKDFTVQKREKMLEKIRDTDTDGIIMASSCFELIPLSKSFHMAQLQVAKDTIHRIATDKAKATSGLKKKREAIEKALQELSSTLDDACHTVYFDELGITRLFVDEAHNYKNVPIETKVDRVLGISATGSKKCRDMMDKVRLIQKENNGGGVVMATGTPITNSITDAFVMQKYLQSGELALLDLQNFDSWIGMFAERVTEFEIDVDTSSYRLATRFSKFHNLPELTALLSSIADFHQADETAGLPHFESYNDALIGKTRDFSSYLQGISARADRVRRGISSRKDDNMLKITTDGRKAALDMRLVNPAAPMTPQCKAARCVENVCDIYFQTMDTRSVQLIFCDSSTPKQGFNLYDDVKSRLVNMGIPEEEIAFVHDADTDLQRAKMFAAARAGDIRILMGSTFKLGLGVNVQNKLIALHHLDIPWRPADQVQREGRILRQGNENKQVYIYRYVTEGSFDAYSWQLLETKQRFISGLLSGSLSERSGADIENTVLNYAEVKALAVGNPLIKKRVETANELTRHLALQKKAIEAHILMEQEWSALPGRISHRERVIEQCRADLEEYQRDVREYGKEERKILREKIFAAVKANALQKEERRLMTYQGFGIVLPANMTAEKPYVWLERNGRYYLELGDTEVGVLIRIDHFLDKLEEHLLRMQKGLEEMRVRQTALRGELDRKEDYTDKIDEIKSQLREIDKQLGVTKE